MRFDDIYIYNEWYPRVYVREINLRTHVLIYVCICIYVIHYYVYIYINTEMLRARVIMWKSNRNRVQTTYGYRSFGPGSKKEGTRVARVEAARTHSWLPCRFHHHLHCTPSSKVIFFIKTLILHHKHCF